MKVYTDRMRIGNIIFIHLLFIAGLVWLLFNASSHWLLSAMMIAVIILFSFIVLNQGKLFIRKQLNYQITSVGIRDYSQSEKGILLPWQNISRVEMLADQSDFQIMITGYTDDQPFVVILIERFSLRWKVFANVWKEIKKYADIYPFELLDHRIINKN